MQLEIQRRRNQKHRGVAHLLIAGMIAALVTMAGITVNLAYVQLLRTQQKVAVDAAAKAAVEALARTEDEAEAATAALDLAAMYQLGNEPMVLNSANIHFGNSSEQEDGSFLFQVGHAPVNSARIVSNTGAVGETPGVSLFFPSMKYKKFKGSVTSVSTYLMNEVVLCLDRSGSMKFDMTGVEWSYPTNNPFVSDGNYYNGRPHPDDSRWAKLLNAIDVFFEEAETSVNPPRVGLVTWSSGGNADGTNTVEYTLPANGIAFSTNKTAIVNALVTRSQGTGTGGVFGGTQMKSGMNAGITALKSANAHDMANRVMVLLTDGEYQGEDPYDAALLARDEGITVHCISLLTGSTFTLAQSIAEVTGGGAYMATNAEELEAAFAEIARSLNVVLTQ